VIDELFKALREIKREALLFPRGTEREDCRRRQGIHPETGRVALSGTTAQLCEEDQVKKAYFGTDVCEV
jgi:hypothetical protein